MIKSSDHNQHSDLPRGSTTIESKTSQDQGQLSELSAGVRRKRSKKPETRLVPILKLTPHMARLLLNALSWKGSTCTPILTAFRSQQGLGFLQRCLTLLPTIRSTSPTLKLPLGKSLEPVSQTDFTISALEHRYVP